MAKPLGYIGLGNMGAPMVANMVKAGLSVSTYDMAGTGTADSVDDLARACAAVFVCVPDGAASRNVVEAIKTVNGRCVASIVNLSTTGIEAAEGLAETLDSSGIQYVDAPVSGGMAGAVAGTITVMWSGPEALLEDTRPVLETFAGSVFFVGARAGQGQAMKLLNNFLSATALAATSEAIAFGEAQGLDMKTMLDVVNVSTGRNTATSDKFVNRILPGTFDAGFRMALMEKDVSLYIEAVHAAGSPDRVGSVMADYWRDGVEAFPDGDFTEIYKLVKMT
jgi:3-hydroxyisobutyrate dehydrogenase